MAKKQKSTLGLLGILLLVIGVAAGVILVMQVQDFRNKAKELENETFVVCHKEEGGDYWSLIEVKESELEEYLNRGDILGGCPVE
ncbi:hypothetical protein A2865_03220 [Candidatus Woesebacteria bacterium RIFCSPHIGHO2_01_FULL_39_17]|uniref:Uncharacterized protein n=3 Tax=Candidatus Woeseibacteriota TaxID=1752722 RepID=A0A0G0RJ52_9BACT|nr:MAG: hypothetical protein US72_C0012G0019 [Microgenomates group bacterium GW2011_GWC1_38_12]KKQ93480.1 MAG: hypothetical protein UT19_C0011G0025 [Candidatus Woesebacteria bacterium GW2011_GWB1_39_10b]KKR13642.1 MAG: hypothetical protein UT40_C0012G0008 [Candidatus Woesebacteria bacterium GW2011_GWA1_39_21b]OGM23238.1 MAG: hypothetical protein A2865_03220 [Candidatus Woesebacteria bacterium RIFCSPHIGHO2_01_FULL_39_17]OGM65690.1 MAG: hypothetical protein A3A52_05170 [Candidatus Woesebacteria b